MMIEIKCYEVIGMCFYVILFNCKMPMQVLFQIKFPQKDVWWLLGNTGIHHIGAPDDLIVFIVFQQFWVIS